MLWIIRHVTTEFELLDWRRDPVGVPDPRTRPYEREPDSLHVGGH